MKNIDIKICGITSSQSIHTAAQNNIRSLGFTSNNLPGPNTCDDQKIVIGPRDTFSAPKNSIRSVKQISDEEGSLFLVRQKN